MLFAHICWLGAVIVMPIAAFIVTLEVDALIS